MLPERIIIVLALRLQREEGVQLAWPCVLAVGTVAMRRCWHSTRVQTLRGREVIVFITVNIVHLFFGPTKPQDAGV